MLNLTIYTKTRVFYNTNQVKRTKNPAVFTAERTKGAAGQGNRAGKKDVWAAAFWAYQEKQEEIHEDGRMEKR